MLVVDQLAPIDPLEAYPVDRFERARDPSHARLLPESTFASSSRRTGSCSCARGAGRAPGAGAYLDLAGAHGRGPGVRAPASPHGPEAYTAVLGWYLLERRSP